MFDYFQEANSIVNNQWMLGEGTLNNIGFLKFS